MNERIRRPFKYENFLQELGGPVANSEKPFDSLKSALIFAAAIAAAKELKPEQFEKSGEKIPFAYFSGEYERSFISALALLVEGNDVSIIHPSRLPEQIEIFEEMACAGLGWLEKALSGQASPEAFLLSLVSDSNTQKSIIDEILA